jgi:hypothetical protein
LIRLFNIAAAAVKPINCELERFRVFSGKLATHQLKAATSAKQVHMTSQLAPFSD